MSTTLLTMVNKRTRRTKQEMYQIKYAIHEEATARPNTVRGLFYQMVKQDVIEKTEEGYKVIMRLTGEMRENDQLPWACIMDHTRLMRKPDVFGSMEAALENCAATYRRDLMAQQSDYIEVWCDKNALLSVLWPITEKWGVPLMVSVGFSSKGFLHNTAEYILSQNKAAYIYQVGDHDPSGDKAWKAIQNSLLRYGVPKDMVHFERLAVTPQQIKDYKLPTRPTKTKGTHAKNWKGGRSVEADALEPEVLQQIVEEAILRHVNERQLEINKIAEESERSILAALKIPERLRKKFL